MPSPIWTPGALSSEARELAAKGWRLVEAQHKVSTLKLVDTLDEQALLEDLIEETKPKVPAECEHLHYLLKTPFRYSAIYPHGSRFRRAGLTLGVFYASEKVETALAEMAFYRLLFFAESPGTPWPLDAAEYTAFVAPIRTGRAIDLTASPLDTDREAWTHLTDYEACQALAERAREGGIELIRYESVRDPAHGANLAVLTCACFAKPAPIERQTWRMRLSRAGVQAICEHPVSRISFGRDAFGADPRVAGFDWER